MSIVIKEEVLASIPTPATDKTTLFVDIADGKLKRKNDLGTVVDLELGAVSSFNGRIGAVVPASGDYSATLVINTPAGNIAATDVQTAINELDTEKLTTAHAGTGGTAHAQVTTSVDGFMIAADKTKLDGIATGATANAADSFLLDRANHTNTQASSTVTGTAAYIPWFDNSGFLEPNLSLNINGTSNGVFQSLNHQPNNLGGYQINSAYMTFDPLANSPTDNYNVINTTVEFDINSNGFSQGTDGEAAALFNNYFKNFGTGNIGGIAFIKNSFDIGNSTDPITIRGMSYSYGFGSFNNNVTINGPLQGYGFQPNATNAVTFTSAAYTNAFYDAANIQTSVPGWNSGSFSPQIAEIQNNGNYIGVSVNPTIPLFTGNAGFTGVGIFGNLGTIGSNGFQGINMNPQVTSTVNATGLYINMGSITASGSKKAIDVVGDVNINGALQFTGNLNTGKIDAFYAVNPVDGGGDPSTLHSLITSITALNGVTTANADMLAVNTAMLIELQTNSITTSGPLGMGLTPLAVPCVVQTHTGATLDYMNAGIFVLSLDGASTGGTIDRVNLCRSVAIPNGITTVNELVGFLHEAPFGDVGTDSWGFYSASVNANNYFANLVRIGAGSDKVSNAQALEVVGTTQLNGNIGFFGTTEAAQQTGGVATATGTYTATEQGMLQTVYDALRTYGLLS